MHRRNAFVAALLILFISTYNMKAQQVSWGFRAGVSFANFTNHVAEGSDTDIDFGSGAEPIPPGINQVKTPFETSLTKDLRTGLFANFIIEVKLSTHWSLETGMGYSQKGIDLEYSTTTFPDGMITETRAYSRDIDLDYLTFPAVFRFHPGKTGKFYTLSGLYAAVLVRQDGLAHSVIHREIDIPDLNPEISTLHSRESDIDVHQADMGLVLGMGYAWPVKNKISIGLDIRMNMGLINIPSNYEERGFMSFSSTSKNLNLETGIRIAGLL